MIYKIILINAYNTNDEEIYYETINEEEAKKIYNHLMYIALRDNWKHTIVEARVYKTQNDFDYDYLEGTK